MRTLTALALVLGMTGASAPAALAQQTTPSPADPGAQQDSMPGGGDTTGTGDTMGTGDAAQGTAPMTETQPTPDPTMTAPAASEPAATRPTIRRANIGP